MKRFFADESGAVTIDWVVVAASLLGISLAMTVIISDGFSSAAHSMNQGIAYNDIPEDMRVLLAAAYEQNAATAAAQEEAGDTPSGDSTGTQTGSPTTDTGGDTGSDTGGDTGSDTGGDTGSDTGGDTGSDTGGDTGSDTGGDNGCTWFCGGWNWGW